MGIVLIKSVYANNWTDAVECNIATFIEIEDGQNARGSVAFVGKSKMESGFPFHVPIDLFIMNEEILHL